MKLFILPFKENTIWQDFNGGFKYIYIYIYRTEFKLN